MDDAWPVAGIRVAGGGVVLRPVVEADLAALAAALPDDFELDPSVESAATLPRPHHLLMTYRQDRAAWRADSWKLHLLASTSSGLLVGEQILEAESFATARTVDSASWVASAERGRGFGTAMRAAMLALAFDGLGARCAITSAWHDNVASLAVSRGLGYGFDHVERFPRGDADDDLVHLQLSAEAWRSAAHSPVQLTGVAAALPLFGLPPHPSP